MTRRKRRKKPKRLRKAWGLSTSVERTEASNRAKLERLAAIRSVIEELSLDKVVELAVSQTSDERRQQARDLVARRTGKSWEENWTTLTTLATIPKRSREERLREVYEKLSVPELQFFLVARPQDAMCLDKLLKEKLRFQKLSDARGREKRLHRSGIVVRVNPKKGRSGPRSSRTTDGQPESSRTTDYMKPHSDEYDMPEYDLE